jgi:hypothetical protein
MSSDEVEFHLFSLNCAYNLKNFVSQKSESSAEDTECWRISVSKVEELQHVLWPEIVVHIKREVIFNDLIPTWSETETPSEEDLPKFVSIFDPKSRRSYDLSSITNKDLERWNDERILQLNIFVFSNSVKNKKMWDAVEKKLITPADKDRAGAAAEAEIGRMVESLKQIHRHHYVAPYITWRRWADYLLKQPGHSRDAASLDPPPHHLIHLFCRAQTNAEALVADVRQNLSIGEGLNQDFSIDVANLATEFSAIKTFSQELNKAVESFERRLESMTQKVGNTNESLKLFRSAVGVTEDQYGRDLYDNIQEQEDVDHVL